jgi:hypothetical protein
MYVHLIPLINNVLSQHSLLFALNLELAASKLIGLKLNYHIIDEMHWIFYRHQLRHTFNINIEQN